MFSFLLGNMIYNIEQGCVSVDDVLCESKLRFLRDVLAACPSNNIPAEFRFSRMRTHKHASNGRAPEAATVACNHALGEFSAMHGVAVKRQPIQQYITNI